MEIKYRQYRDFEKLRIEANDTMMALLVGSKLATQTLSLTTGSKVRISEIFPTIPHIKRFDVETEKAREILGNAERLLGTLAVPQVLALHEDLIVGMLKFIEINDTSAPRFSKSSNTSTMHENLETAASHSFDPETLELFHLLRLMRNAHIHSGGKASEKLAAGSAALSPSAIELWSEITKSPAPKFQQGADVGLRVTELIATLAITKRLARSANRAIQKALSRETWASVLIDDMKSEGLKGNRAQQIRKIRGFARVHYSSLSIRDTEIEKALDSSI